LTIAGREFGSRLILAPAVSAPEAMATHWRERHGEVTVALRRADLSGKRRSFANILEFIDPKRTCCCPTRAAADERR